ncbi:MAG TPA: DUF2892 domain-containing protein [Anaerolineae bacterium]|nr:DUF2892 domain-containing protein [Anaerolineae bacterium]
MNQNVGSTDRLIRIVLGLILAVVGFFHLFGVGGTLGFILGIVGLILLVTGALSWCPLYIPFKISTRK